MDRVVRGRSVAILADQTVWRILVSSCSQIAADQSLSDPASSWKVTYSGKAQHQYFTAGEEPIS